MYFAPHRNTGHFQLLDNHLNNKMHFWEYTGSDIAEKIRTSFKQFMYFCNDRYLH